MHEFQGGKSPLKHNLVTLATIKTLLKPETLPNNPNILDLTFTSSEETLAILNTSSRLPMRTTFPDNIFANSNIG